MSKYEIGQHYSMERPVGLFAPDAGVPRWFALKTKPQRMDSAVAYLQRNDVVAWFPTREVYSRNRFRPRERIMRDVPIAPGYVFAQFPGEPNWERCFETLPGRLYLAGVVSIGGLPAVLKEDDLLRMKQMRAYLRKLQKEATEATRIRAGDRARVSSGSMTGWIVDVSSVGGGFASILLPLLGARKVSVDLADLERLE